MWFYEFYIVLHNLKDLGITGNLGVWFYEFYIVLHNLKDLGITGNLDVWFYEFYIVLHNLKDLGITGNLGVWFYEFYIVLHNLKDLGITGNLGVWFYEFLTDKIHYVRLPGGVGKESPILIGAPQGTVLDPLLFIIMISDIGKDSLSSVMIGFGDDTRFFYKIIRFKTVPKI